MGDPEILAFRLPMLRSKPRPAMPPGRPTVAFPAPSPGDPTPSAGDRPTAVLDARKRPDRRPTEFPIELAAIQRQLAIDLDERDRLAGLCDAAREAAAATRAILATMSIRNRPADLLARFGRENDEVSRLGQLWLDAIDRIERHRAEIDRIERRTN